MDNKQEIEFSRKHESDSGCTATVCLITDKHIFFVNAGDSRQMLVRCDEKWNGYKLGDNYFELDFPTSFRKVLRPLMISTKVKSGTFPA